MLSFICSTDETQKLNEIYRRAEADAAQGKSVFILVPEQYSMYAEQKLISTLGLPCQSKIQILTFSRLCNLVFSKMGPLRTNYIDKAGKHILTRRALQLSAKNLSFFRRNLGRKGFTGLIRSTISEFKRYGVTPDGLRSAAESTDDQNLTAKLLDLAEIYKNFNALIDMGYCNSEDNLSLIISKIKNAPFLKGCCYVNFFKSFTPTEYAVLSNLMQVSDLCVALTTDIVEGESRVFASQINTYQKLLKIASESNTKTEAPLFLQRETSSTLHPDLEHLRDNFFSYRPEAYPEKPKHVHLLRPDNYREEVTLCARLIRRLVREEGYTFNDFLILTGSMESYEPLIPRIFAEYGISHFLDRKIPLTESPFMRMLLSVLEILAYGFSYDRIMRIARSGYFPVTMREADIFENYVLAADIPHSLWTTRKDWTYNPNRHSFDMEYINSVKAKLVHPILDLIDMFSGRKTAKTICTNLYSWMNSVSVPKRVGKKITFLRANGEYQKSEHLRRVWNSFISVTSQISDSAGDEFSTFSEFLDLFAAACGELNIGMIPPTQDKVLISAIDLFRSTGSKVVIILGALDGVFPRDYMTEGLISDAERLLLEEAGLSLAPDNLHRQLEEQFLIYSVITTAKEQLYVFSPLSNRDGGGLKPSEIVYTLTDDLFPQLRDEADLLRDDLASIETCDAAFSGLTSKLFEVDWNLDKLSPLWSEVRKNLLSKPYYAKRLSDLEEMHKRKALSQKLSLKTAKKLYGEPLVLSVSKLEKYNSCAFSFFLRYGLAAQERLLGGLNPADTGTILHDVLCSYFKAKAEENADYSKIDRSQCSGEISALIDKAAETANENLSADSNYYKYMMLRLKGIATSTAWKMIKFYSQSDFRPTGFEVSFGTDAQYPPYEIDANGEKVFLEGFIDRVDTAEIGGTPSISITDYKSSERTLSIPLAEAGIRFQPLIYANALLRHLTSSQVAALFYLQMNEPIPDFVTIPDEHTLEKEITKKIAAHGLIVDDPDVIHSIDHAHGDKTAIHHIPCTEGSLLSRKEFEELLAKADKKAAESADKILSGVIDVNPSFTAGNNPCTYCPYSSICSAQ